MARAIYRHNVMNKTEARYAMKLRAFVSSGLVKEFAYDFMVINVDDVVEFHEVKGFWRDDARVKIKAAADKFPFRFIAAQEVGGKWKYEEIKGKQGDSIVGGQK
jgi:ribonuclease BN (tRNA processing enzyme)